jgi:hypothetical protein
MTPLVAIFSVVVLLDLFTRIRLGPHHAQPCTLETARTSANPPESATPARPGIADQNR